MENWFHVGNFFMRMSKCLAANILSFREVNIDYPIRGVGGVVWEESLLDSIRGICSRYTQQSIHPGHVDIQEDDSSRMNSRM